MCTYITRAYEYPSAEMKTQLLTSFHHKTNHTMSDNGEWLEHYYGNTLEDQYDDDLPDTTSVDEMKRKERDILHAERKVDAQIHELGDTDLRRKLYERGTRALQVRIAVEDKDMEDDDMNDKESLHKQLKIENPRRHQVPAWSRHCPDIVAPCRQPDSAA